MIVEDNPPGAQLLKNRRVLWIRKSMLFRYGFGFGFQIHTK